MAFRRIILASRASQRTPDAIRRVTAALRSHNHLRAVPASSIMLNIGPMVQSPEFSKNSPRIPEVPARTPDKCDSHQAERTLAKPKAERAKESATCAQRPKDSRLGAEQRSLRCAQPRTQGCAILLCAPSPPAFPSSPVLSRVLRRVSVSLPEQPYEDKISDPYVSQLT